MVWSLAVISGLEFHFSGPEIFDPEFRLNSGKNQPEFPENNSGLETFPWDVLYQYSTRLLLESVPF
jgi:hypothetical protein